MSRLLVTARTVLEPIAMRHLADLLWLRTDPRVMRWMRGGVETPAQVAATLAGYIEHWRVEGFGMFAVSERRTGRFVGEIGLWRRDDGRGVACRVALMPGRAGGGIATEAGEAMLRFAFETAALPHVVAMSQGPNLVAQRSLQKLGMTLVERYVASDGTALTFWRLAAEEWRALQAATR
jgi:RimJ/RimL family protein N-acetyltransferase